MPTNQPIWKLVGTVGDVNPFDYDGGFVYEDTTGAYPPELEWIEAQDDGSGDAGPWKVYRFILDRCETVSLRESVLLVPYGFASRTDLPYPIERYDEWFNDSLENVAESTGIAAETMRVELCHEDAMVRARVYLDLAQYHGFGNFDNYPLDFSDREELEEYHTRKNTAEVRNAQV